MHPKTERALNEIRELVSQDMPIPSNGWFNGFEIEIYIRKSQWVFNKELQPCIDLANVNVSERMQEKGIFTEFLEGLEKIATELHLPIRIENVINENLEMFLLSRGYWYQEASTLTTPILWKEF